MSLIKTPDVNTSLSAHIVNVSFMVLMGLGQLSVPLCGWPWVYEKGLDGTQYHLVCMCKTLHQPLKECE